VATVEEKLLALAGTLCIYVAAHAAMSNHCHASLYINLEQAQTLDNLAIIEHCRRLFKGTV